MSFNGLSPIAFESVSAVTATPSVEVGTNRVEGGNHYVYVYNDCNSTIAIGNGMVLQSGATGYSCSISSVTATDLCVGVVKHANITTGTYGWALTKGFGTVQMLASSGSVAVGVGIELGANGLFAPVSNTTGNGSVVGKALAAIVSGASGSAYISVF